MVANHGVAFSRCANEEGFRGGIDLGRTRLMIFEVKTREPLIDFSRGHIILVPYGDKE
jgi:hypothetical protein